MDHTYFYSLFGMIALFIAISVCLWTTKEDDDL